MYACHRPAVALWTSTRLMCRDDMIAGTDPGSLRLDGRDSHGPAGNRKYTEGHSPWLASDSAVLAEFYNPSGGNGTIRVASSPDEDSVLGAGRGLLRQKLFAINLHVARGLDA